MIDNPDKFWQRVIEQLKLEGISVRKLCQLIDAPYTTVKSAQDRRQIPGTEIVLKIAEHFGLTMEYLLTGKDPWTGKILKPSASRLMEEIATAPDETQARIKAILEADRAMLEKKKKGKPEDNNGVPPRAANED